ncbi:MmcQ/YjbR family DNA-binding protein [Nocardiopsis trehalosi]|uniref:MmcQ/YjbR family DNA-binding protein n=1 Tax=Nocardiopsis trehalosi TaxID=109329 RepID=UPI00082FE67C|nr:MmcQ/YjbR family DNA-binding protein [Nocardiopsis trehalosi]
MDGVALQDAARRHAEGLPSSALEYPFGPDWEVFKVRGKVFMLLTSVPGAPVVILKSEPGEAEALRETHPDITPGYHMNKRHWITLRPGGPIDRRLVEELVTESYRLVVANLPRADRPVDPASYGTRPRAARR